MKLDTKYQRLCRHYCLILNGKGRRCVAAARNKTLYEMFKLKHSQLDLHHAQEAQL